MNSEKIYLTLFRIIASLGIATYLGYCIKKNETWSLLTCISLVLAGATGNIIDCVFYGKLFNYAPYFYGKVVDMFYFPLFSFNWPEWMPYVGGEHFIFFQPIFNFADAAISVGIVVLIIFYSKYLATTSNNN